MNSRMKAHRKQRLELASRYATSGLSAKEFCRQHDFPEHQFYYWIKIIRNKKQPSPVTPPGNFVAVKLKGEQEAARAPIVEAACPNGITLRFYAPVNFSELRSLIR